MAVPYKLSYLEIETGLSPASTFKHSGDFLANRIIKYLGTSNDILLADGTTSSLSGKQNTITLTTSGSSGAATLIGATLNIPNYAPDLTGYVTLDTTQTITGAKTFSLDSSFNGVDIGRGNGSFVNIQNNTRVGREALGSNTSGTSLTAIGGLALKNITSGNANTGVGYFVLPTLTTGSQNIGIGNGAGWLTLSSSDLTTTSNSIFIGNTTRASANGNTNEIVIGDVAQGNGSNTVTIGNSSITDNYFKGNVRGGAFIKSGG